MTNRQKLGIVTLWYSSALFGGILLLLYGIKLLNDGLQNAAGPKIRSLLRSLTSNRLTAVGAGAFITGLIQSSSATSVMLVGFVSAGLMSFRQTLAVILGADIGATITVQLIAFHVYDYSLLLVGAGISLMFFSRRTCLQEHRGRHSRVRIRFSFPEDHDRCHDARSRKMNSSGQVFVALSGMPALAILLSAVLTALIHSSAATMGIALALAESGLISLEAALYIVLGANIGTCATALIASLRTPAEARRVAWAHVLFKVFGVLLFLPFLDSVRTISLHRLHRISPARSRMPIPCSTSSWQSCSCLLPRLFARMIVKLVPEKPEEKKFGPMYLDDHVLATPALALGQATREALARFGYRPGNAGRYRSRAFRPTIRTIINESRTRII